MSVIGTTSTELGSWAGEPMASLPVDQSDALLIGRVWDPDVEGPTPVVVRDGDVLDVSLAYPTIRDLCEVADPAAAAREVQGRRLGVSRRSS